MPHGQEFLTIGSTEAWRVVAGARGVEGLNSLLSQTAPGRGFNLGNEGDTWNLYSASGDSYDLAHRLFGSTLYIEPFSVGTPHLASPLLPVEEDEMTPLDPGIPTAPVLPVDEPSGWNAPDWWRSVQQFSQGVLNPINVAISSLTGSPSSALASQIDDAIRKPAMQQPGSIFNYNKTNPLEGFAERENQIARVLGFQFRR